MADLNSLTGLPSLPITSSMFANAKPAPSGYLGPKEIGPAQQEIRQAQAQAEQKVGQDDVAIEQAKREETAQKAEAMQGLYERQGKEARELPERQKLNEARDKLATMTFSPHKDTAQDLATTFSLIGIIGMVAGKGNAQGALGAMNGMLQGYQQGREDLYKKQRTEFDKNFKAMEAKISTLRQELDEAMKLKLYDKEAGEQAITAALARSESPLLKAIRNKQGDVAVLNLVKNSEKDFEKLVDTQNRMQQAADTRKQTYELKQQQLAIQRESLALRREAMQQKAASGGTSGRGGALNGRYAFNITESFGQAATDLLNVTQMPAGTVLSTFSGLTGATPEAITKSLASTFARAMTDKDARQMQQLVSGLEFNMSRALGGGYASSSSKAILDAYKQQIPKQGDSPQATAMFLARMKQELSVLGKAFKGHPGANEEMTRNMDDYVKLMDRAIPFTVPEVIAASSTGKPTIGDKFQELASSPVTTPLPAASEQDQQALDWANSNPNDPRAQAIKKRLGAE